MAASSARLTLGLGLVLLAVVLLRVSRVVLRLVLVLARDAADHVAHQALVVAPGALRSHRRVGRLSLLLLVPARALAISLRRGVLVLLLLLLVLGRLLQARVLPHSVRVGLGRVDEVGPALLVLLLDPALRERAEVGRVGIRHG